MPVWCISPTPSMSAGPLRIDYAGLIIRLRFLSWVNFCAQMRGGGGTAPRKQAKYYFAFLPSIAAFSQLLSGRSATILHNIFRDVFYLFSWSYINSITCIINKFFRKNVLKTKLVYIPVLKYDGVLTSGAGATLSIKKSFSKTLNKMFWTFFNTFCKLKT